jgi:hypothetical protein
MSSHERAKERLPVSEIEKVLSPFLHHSDKEKSILVAVTLASIIDRFLRNLLTSWITDGFISVTRLCILKWTII